MTARMLDKDIYILPFKNIYVVTVMFREKRDTRLAHYSY